MADNKVATIVTAYVAYIRKKVGRWAATGQSTMKSEPHVTEQQARDWAAAHTDANLVNVKPVRVYSHRVVGY